MKDLNGKVAIVTGASRGIGKIVVDELTSWGVKVIATDILKEELEKTVSEFKALGREVSHIAMDLSTIDRIDELVKFALDTYGTIDILVNNAGVNCLKASINLTEADWDRVNNVNLKSLFFLSQKAGKVMLEKGKGSIINISSINSVRHTSRRLPYNTTKGATNALTRALGNEWARFGVRVNAVGPGYALTDILKNGIKSGVIKEDQILPMIPNKRFVEVEELARVITFLASDYSSGMVGQVLFCDGGLTARCVSETNDFAYDEDPS